MKAIIEIELEIDSEGAVDKSEIEMAILESLDSMWFIGDDMDDDGPMVVLSKSATCKVTGRYPASKFLRKNNG